MEKKVINARENLTLVVEGDHKVIFEDNSQNTKNLQERLDDFLFEYWVDEASQAEVEKAWEGVTIAYNGVCVAWDKLLSYVDGETILEDFGEKTLEDVLSEDEVKQDLQTLETAHKRLDVALKNFTAIKNKYDSFLKFQMPERLKDYVLSALNMIPSVRSAAERLFKKFFPKRANTEVKQRFEKVRTLWSSFQDKSKILIKYAHDLRMDIANWDVWMRLELRNPKRSKRK